ncbi:MAG: hypothetical protein PHY32_00205 [Candidatus Pacebacteria bacterium]|nr:hypothetical protein [Candidatus Paceibacterota bacterium]
MPFHLLSPKVNDANFNALSIQFLDISSLSQKLLALNNSEPICPICSCLEKEFHLS